MSERQRENTSKCIQRDLKLLVSKSYRDTTFEFRISITRDSSLLIICDTNQINHKTEKMLLESKYLPDHLTKENYSFLTCVRSYGNIKEIGFFHVIGMTGKAWEFHRFRIQNNEIDGIICLPGVVNEFMSPREYDSLEANPIVL